MKVVALISGGKDSCFNMMKCVDNGHKVVCLANLYPSEGDELDSYMYQTVGHNAVELYGEACDLPLLRRPIRGKPINTDLNYKIEGDDEVEDLFELLTEVKARYPDVEGVSVGAIMSEYQKIRVENVCSRLNLDVLCYLWNSNQASLLDEMIALNLKAILIKCACSGLSEKHLGKDIAEVRDLLHELHNMYGVNICGEGGEYETLVLDCPFFKHKIVLDAAESFCDSTLCFFYVLREMHLEKK
ncbi:unnamed protein product [Dracunculus medinensis]|uniref:Diphthine--ammonia ligase n=1 Tax=Dracunculus medinensis TaxID=318479 RepID=A0A0N4UMS2_DRAME|nr:unnamed protein product [Dracunculus medinensis]